MTTLKRCTGSCKGVTDDLTAQTCAGEGCELFGQPLVTVNQCEGCAAMDDGQLHACDGCESC